LIVTICEFQVWLVAWKYFRSSQNLPSTPDTADVATPATSPDASAGNVSDQGIDNGAMPMAVARSCPARSGMRILIARSASTASAFTLRWRYWAGHGTR